jgi:hypothetical protein
VWKIGWFGKDHKDSILDKNTTTSGETVISKDDNYPVLGGISTASFIAVESFVLPSDLMGMFDVILSRVSFEPLGGEPVSDHQ